MSSSEHSFCKQNTYVTKAEAILKLKTWGETNLGNDVTKAKIISSSENSFCQQKGGRGNSGLTITSGRRTHFNKKLALQAEHALEIKM